MSNEVYLERAYYATHGFAFIFKGFDDLGCRRLLVVNLRDTSERALLVIRGDEILVCECTIKSNLVFKSLNLLLASDREFIMEVFDAKAHGY